MVRGSKGGLQSSAAARCSSNRVAGGAGTELSPAAGLACHATVTRRAILRPFFSVINAPLAPGAIEARTPAWIRLELARGTGLAFGLAFLERPNTVPPFAVLPAGAVTASTPFRFAVLARVTVGATTRARLSLSVRAVLARVTARARSRACLSCSVRAVLARGTGGARTRACSAERARGTGVATRLKRAERINCSAVLARETGLARSLGIQSALGLTGGACASQMSPMSPIGRGRPGGRFGKEGRSASAIRASAI